MLILCSVSWRCMNNGSSEAKFRGSEPISVAQLGSPGRLIEISGRGANARLSTATNLLRQAQVEGETSAWIQAEEGALYPPDLAAAGIDLEALVVLHLPTDQGARDLLRATEWLLRSGAYGVLVVDLSGVRPPRGQAWCARLVALAREHQVRLILITDTQAHQSSLGPLVGLRIAGHRSPPLAGLCELNVHVLRNKSGGPLRVLPESWRTPTGLEG